MKNFIDRKILPLLLLITALAIAMAMLAPEETLDKKFYYTGDTARALLAGFSEAAKLAYFYNELLDLAFLFAYSTLFYYWALQLFRWPQIALLPGLFDLLETASILISLRNGSYALFDWLGFITCLKWTTGAGAVIAMAYTASLRKFYKSAK